MPRLTRHPNSARRTGVGGGVRGRDRLGGQVGRPASPPPPKPAISPPAYALPPASHRGGPITTPAMRSPVKCMGRKPPEARRTPVYGAVSVEDDPSPPPLGRSSFPSHTDESDPSPRTQERGHLFRRSPGAGSHREEVPAPLFEAEQRIQECSRDRSWGQTQHDRHQHPGRPETPPGSPHRPHPFEHSSPGKARSFSMVRQRSRSASRPPRKDPVSGFESGDGRVIVDLERVSRGSAPCRPGHFRVSATLLTVACASQCMPPDSSLRTATAVQSA